MWYKLDLSIFKEYDDECCDKHNDDGDDPIERCNALKRLITALKYYTLLDIMESKDNQYVFAAFMREVYLRFLDDFEHLVNKHDNLEEINKILRAKKVFDECDVTKCHFTARHHSDDTDDIKILMDPILIFYTKTMDSLHFYVFHLFDCGLRAQDDEVDDNNNKYFDRQFARISRIINDRHRFKNNSKFNIKMEAHRDNMEEQHSESADTPISLFDVELKKPEPKTSVFEIGNDDPLLAERRNTDCLDDNTADYDEDDISEQDGESDKKELLSSGHGGDQDTDDDNDPQSDEPRNTADYDKDDISEEDGESDNSAESVNDTQRVCKNCR